MRPTFSMRAVLLLSVFFYLNAAPIRAESTELLKEAEAEYDKGKYDVAKKKFEEALKTKLPQAEMRRTQHLLALSYFGLGDTRKAIDYWEGLFDDDKNDDIAFKAAYNLGLAYSRLGDTKKAYNALSGAPNATVTRQPAPVQKAYTELLGQTATAVDQQEKAVLAFSSSLKVAADAAARKSLLDQISAASQKLADAEKLQKLADQVDDAEAKKRILDAKASKAQAQAQKPSTLPLPQGDFSIAPGLGVSYMEYTQTALALLQTTAINLSLVTGYRLATDWSVIAYGGMHTLVLKTVGNDTSTRLLRLGAGFEYRFWNGETFRILARLAYTYASLLTPMNKYGFRDLAGPQLMLNGFFSTGGKEGFMIEFGGALLNNDTSRLTTQSYRLVGGIGYRWDYMDGAPPLDIGFRYTHHSLGFSSSSAKGTTVDFILSSQFDFDF